MLHRLPLIFVILFLSIVGLTSCTTNLEKQPTLDQLDPQITWDPRMGHGEWADCSGDLGNHSCNFEFLDQNGMPWELYNHYGKIIILDFATMWCTVCQHVSLETQAIQEKYQSENVIWVTILLQDFNGMPVTDAAAASWADAFNITSAPVLAGDITIADPAERGGFTIQVLPTIVILDREMVVHYYANGWNKTRLLGEIDSLLAAEISLPAGPEATEQ